MKGFILKNRILITILGIILASLTVYYVSYRFTYHTITVMTINKNISKIVDNIHIVNLDAEKQTLDGKTAIEYRLTFRLPSGYEKDDIAEYVNFALGFFDRTCEILGTSMTPQSFNYSPDESQSKSRTYTMEFKVTPEKQGDEDIKYLLSNVKKDIKIFTFNKNKKIKEFQIE